MKYRYNQISEFYLFADAKKLERTHRCEACTRFEYTNSESIMTYFFNLYKTINGQLCSYCIEHLEATNATFAIGEGVSSAKHEEKLW